jgi:hypothetical protein
MAVERKEPAVLFLGVFATPGLKLRPVLIQ